MELEILTLANSLIELASMNGLSAITTMEERFTGMGVSIIDAAKASVCFSASAEIPAALLKCRSAFTTVPEPGLKLLTVDLLKRGPYVEDKMLFRANSTGGFKNWNCSEVTSNRLLSKGVNSVNINRNLLPVADSLLVFRVV